MKAVVLGATGLIGRGIVSRLRQLGHEVKAASQSSGINVVTGEGLERAFEGADTVIDVTNSPGFDEDTANRFFLASCQNIITEAKKAEVAHVAILSVVGCELCTEMPYFGAKLYQEHSIKTSGIPYTIFRATQFFEFIPSIAGTGENRDGKVHLPSQKFQPLAAADLSNAIAELVADGPKDGIVEIGGPEALPLWKAVDLYYQAKGEESKAVGDTRMRYFGAITLEDGEFLPGAEAVLTSITLSEWLIKNSNHRV